MMCLLDLREDSACFLESCRISGSQYLPDYSVKIVDISMEFRS